MSRFLINRYKGMKPYVPGEQPKERRYIKLNTNESPYPPSEKVLAAVRAESGTLRLYPDPENRTLNSALAKVYGLEENQIFTGNGSDEVLAFLYMAFCDGHKGICFPDITYGFYPVYCALFGIKGREIPLKEDFSVDIGDYIGVKENIIIANPNAPTGIALKTGEIEKILKGNPDNLVIIDEAYADFAGGDCLSLLPRYKNLVIVRTFSKSRQLAGGRIGFALADKEIIEDLNKIKFSFNPYNVNRLSLAAGEAAVLDTGYFEECIGKVIATRERTATALRLLGFTLTDSKSNFLFAKHGDLSGKSLYESLRERGILVRHFDEERIRDYIRITVGSDGEMDELLNSVKEILKNKEALALRR